jgi:8-oxo-dGTP pyrophosphatase MutT (NUDIX family)
VSTLLTANFISRKLQNAYQSGVVTFTDGYAYKYKNVMMKCASVLIPLVYWKDEWLLVFTRRTEMVEHHKGQVSFPGGGCEVGESTPEMTALREAQEEIGLKPEDVHLLGRMNDVITITHYRVTPVVGVIPWPYRVRLEPAEVERIFTIPLLWLAERANWYEQPVETEAMLRPFPVVRYHPYDKEVLWGISARITQNLLTILGLLD